MLALISIDNAQSDFISDLLMFVGVAYGDTSNVQKLLVSPVKDLEDALQASADITFETNIIATCKLADFKNCLSESSHQPNLFVGMPDSGFV